MKKILLFIISILVVSCASNDKLIMQSELDKANFSGKVITEEGLPLEGVKILLNSSLEARTDINGNFFYTFLAYGKYKISFEKTDYAKEEFDFEYNIKSKKPFSLKLKMFSLNYLLADGRELIEAKKYADVELIIKKLESINPDQETVLYFKAAYFFISGKYPEAKPIFEVLVKRDRYNIYYHLPLIVIYKNLQLFIEEAQEYLYIGRNFPDEYLEYIKKSADIYKDKLNDTAESDKVMRIYNSLKENKK